MNVDRVIDVRDGEDETEYYILCMAYLMLNDDHLLTLPRGRL